MALSATLSARKFILLWERHLAAILSWLEATPTPKRLNLLGSSKKKILQVFVLCLKRNT